MQRNRNTFKFEAFFILAVCLTPFFFYFTYLCLAHLTSRVLFSAAIPRELDAKLYGFVAIIELILSFMFRTRDTLYFALKCIYLALLIFLLYVNFTKYGLYMKAFLTTNWLAFGVIIYCIEAFDLPFTYLRDQDFGRPTLARPHCIYPPLFSLTRYHDLPPF